VRYSRIWGSHSRRRLLPGIKIPPGLDSVLDVAWDSARNIPGFLMEAEARLLGIIAACAPAGGVIVEIGSFKGKSTVMLGKVAAHYGIGPIIAIDPHNFNNTELQDFKSDPEASSFKEFLANINAAGVASHIEAHPTFSGAVARLWNRPIRFLWIDGDHSYQGAKSDFDGFMPHLNPLGVVALHDSLHEFAGPIRVFVEDILRSDQFGASGFVGSIAWSQFRPQDGSRFQKHRARLEQVAAPLLPFVKDDRKLRGLTKIRYKLARSRVPRREVTPGEWAALIEN
jgi:predicted O-methyltransferase YrrM